MEISEYPAKKDVIRRYRDAKSYQKAILEGGVNAAYRIQLNCDGEEFSFTLTASELSDLCGEFRVQNIEELFKPNRSA